MIVDYPFVTGRSTPDSYLTGEKVIEDNFRDFKEFDQRNYDEILGLFENLRSMETQLVGIFVPQETSATRYVFTE